MENLKLVLGKESKAVALSGKKKEKKKPNTACLGACSVQTGKWGKLEGGGGTRGLHRVRTWCNSWTPTHIASANVLQCLPYVCGQPKWKSGQRQKDRLSRPQAQCAWALEEEVLLVAGFAMEASWGEPLRPEQSSCANILPPLHPIGILTVVVSRLLTLIEPWSLPTLRSRCEVKPPFYRAQDGVLNIKCFNKEQRKCRNRSNTILFASHKCSFNILLHWLNDYTSD